MRHFDVLYRLADLDDAPTDMAPDGAAARLVLARCFGFTMDVPVPLFVPTGGSASHC